MRKRGRTVRHVHNDRERKLKDDERPDRVCRRAILPRNEVHDREEDVERDEHGHADLEDALKAPAVDELREE